MAPPRFFASVVCCDLNGIPHQDCHTIAVGYFTTREEAMRAGEHRAAGFNRVTNATGEFYSYRVRVVPDDEW